MSGTLVEKPPANGLAWIQQGLPALLWNSLVAAAAATAICLVLLGRTVPTQASLGWVLSWVLLFGVAMLWLMGFSHRLVSQRGSGHPGVLATLAVVEGPLFLLSCSIGALVYLSDDAHHHFTSLLFPLPAVGVLLAALVTMVAQESVLCRQSTSRWEACSFARVRCRRWAIPMALLLLGLLQGSSYMWVIGNDFTRYWAVADAIASWAGYPASIHQHLYIAAGMSRHSIELPLFPGLLLISFALFGHNTLGAHVPALLANVVLPLILYAFYRKAGLGRPLAFAAACVVVLFPFFRLYTLNAPVPDAVFVSLLATVAWVFLHLAGKDPIPGNLSQRGRDGRNRIGIVRALPWVAFGVLGGLTALTRPEGILFVAVMFVGLLPHLLGSRLILAAAAYVATIAPFSLLMLSTFGMPWPRNAGSSFGLHHVAGNLDWLGRISLRWYAGALGLSPSDFVLLIAVLSAAGIAGALWMARWWWQLALLPMAAWLHVAIVFTIDPRVSGADQWFDFFRHISYGMPFVVLPLLMLAQGALGRLGRGWAWLAARLGSTLGMLPACRLRVSAGYICALLLLVISAYQLSLLARPTRAHDPTARQLLTSDVWVSFSSVVTHRHPLPVLPFARQEGILMIDPGFEYTPRHLSNVRRFFEPVSSLRTGKGMGYQVSSLLAMLFGFFFATGETGGAHRSHGREPEGGQAP